MVEPLTSGLLNLRLKRDEEENQGEEVVKTTQLEARERQKGRRRTTRGKNKVNLTLEYHKKEAQVESGTGGFDPPVLYESS